MSAFCEPDTTTSTPHSSIGRSTTPSPDTASNTLTAPWAAATSASARTSFSTPVEVSDCVVKSALTSPPRSASARSTSAGVDLLAPLGLEVHGLGAVGIAQLRPALPELPGGRDDRDVARREQVRDRRLHRAGPGGGEQQHVVARLEDHLQALQHAGVDLDERGRAVVQDRLRHHLRDRRRQRRGARRHEVLLAVDLGHRRAAENSERPGAPSACGSSTPRSGAARRPSRRCVSPGARRGFARPRRAPHGGPPPEDRR